jgi:hypothetical protein
VQGSRGRELDLLQKIWNFAKENLKTQEIKNNLLLATDFKGNTAWHLAAEGGKPDVLKKIRDWANNSLTTEEIKIMLLATETEIPPGKGSILGQTRRFAKYTALG